ncbi:hypothetical protein QNO09_18875 [Streptomyces sp. 378]|nr:hypothetical protein [Streptomyces sp. 378]MDK1345325.1 hypothetical protein [Streptomyces sp. 378]
MDEHHPPRDGSDHVLRRRIDETRRLAVVTVRLGEEFVLVFG